MTYQCPHCYRAEDEPHRWDCEDSQISVDDLEKLADAAVAFEADEIGRSHFEEFVADFRAEAGMVYSPTAGDAAEPGDLSL